MPTDHDAIKARSYANLEKARAAKTAYSSNDTRASIIVDLRERMAKAGKEDFNPHPWQIDVGEALHHSNPKRRHPVDYFATGCS